MYNIKVPVTHYEDINLDEKQLVQILRQEQKKLSGKWDAIVKRNDGTAHYYNRGYGSHDIGEKDGPDVSQEVLKNYNTIEDMISYLKEKYEERTGEKIYV
jgi:hypothetical protein